MPPNLFLDTKVFLDYVIPARKRDFACSTILLGRIGSGKYEAWTNDFVLSELLGELKADIERRKGFTQIKQDVLSNYEIQELVRIIEQVKKIPNLTIFSDPVDQHEVYETVRKACIETKDATILLSAISLYNRLRRPTWLVTRDERVLVRAGRLFSIQHPCSLIESCPHDCGSRDTCEHRK